MVNRNFLHYLALGGLIALGTLLREWHLDLKPLWLDEVITALFSLGRNYDDVPLNVVFSLEALQQLFTFKTALSCPQIAQNIATQSTHPPLFFCLLHTWMHLFGSDQDLAWMRELPALFGICAIAAIYWLNTVAFSRRAGLMASALMAVSPFAVYLSQEARHYTLPLLLITLALVGLIYIVQDLSQDRLRSSVLLLWTLVNSIGFYVHYFFILAFVAQITTLLMFMFWQRRRLTRDHVVAIAVASIVVVASFIPWFPVMVNHFNRSETTWLPQAQNIAPIYQTLLSWVLIIAALPVENQPLWVAIPAGMLMLIFSVWVGWQVVQGLQQLWQHSRQSTLILGSFTLCVLLEFFTIVYFLNKDITIAPRYNFVYFPSLCALIAACLAQFNQRNIVDNDDLFNAYVQEHESRLATRNYLFEIKKKAAYRLLTSAFQSFSKVVNSSTRYVLLFSLPILSCIFVVNNLVFQKPFNPQQVAQNMNFEPHVPVMMVMGYKNYQDVALGLSFGLALDKIRDKHSATDLAFFERSHYESVWRKLAVLPVQISMLNLWVVAPGLRRRDYPSTLTLANHSCIIDASQHYRIGIPYQLYRCQ